MTDRLPKVWRPYEIWKQGQIVENGGKMFVCTHAHRSTDQFDKGRFERFKPHKDEEPAEVIRKLDWEEHHKYAFITSMNLDYYDKCGKAMLQSWKRHASAVGPIFLYNEQLFEPKVKGVFRAGWQLGPQYIQFQKRHRNRRVKTFAKKAFPIMDAMDRIKCDRLIWLDADSMWVRHLPTQLISLISPDHILSTHFSVHHIKNDTKYHSCETGFFILNKKHKGYKDFCNTYKDIYYNDKTDGLRRFYDGEVYGKTVDAMKVKGYEMMNLSSGEGVKTPIPRSVLAPYLEHYKAGLKERVDWDEVSEDEEDV